MQELDTVRVLLVDDDEDDYVLTRILFTEVRGHKFELEWAKSYDLGLEAMVQNRHDVCLLDYHLGGRNGIELLRAALARGCQMPVILLTGLGEHDVDVAGMNAGAADYLVKASLRPESLERSIRYALERQRTAADSAFEQAGLIALGTDLAAILTRPDSLAAILQQSADSLFRHLSVHLVQLWILDPRTNRLRLSATAGAITELDSAENLETDLDPAQFMPPDGKPVLVNGELGDIRVPCQEWIQREEVSSYLGYPLMIEDRIIGLMSVYSHTAVSLAVVQQIDSVASGLALCVERKQGEMQIQKLLAFPNADPHPVVEFDAEGSLVYANDATQELAKALGVEDALAILPDEAGEIARQALLSAHASLGQDVAVNGKTVSWSFIPIPDSQAVFCYGVEISGAAARPIAEAAEERQNSGLVEYPPTGPAAMEMAGDLERIIAELKECLSQMPDSNGRDSANSTSRTGLEGILLDVVNLRARLAPLDAEEESTPAVGRGAPAVASRKSAAPRPAMKGRKK